MEADRRHAQFFHMTSDHVTLLNIYRGWIAARKSEKWCRENFINFKTLQEAEQIRDQLQHIMEAELLPINSCGQNSELIQKAVCAGFFRNTATFANRSQGEYIKQYTNSQMEVRVFLHKGSALNGLTYDPSYIVCHQVTETKKPFMKYCTEISSCWLQDGAIVHIRRRILPPVQEPTPIDLPGPSTIQRKNLVNPRGEAVQVHNPPIIQSNVPLPPREEGSWCTIL